eukprot:jgi/Botrbrau1/16948/Bobra.49_2s0014.1
MLWRSRCPQDRTMQATGSHLTSTWASPSPALPMALSREWWGTRTTTARADCLQRGHPREGHPGAGLLRRRVPTPARLRIRAAIPVRRADPHLPGPRSCTTSLSCARPAASKIQPLAASGSSLS